MRLAIPHRASRSTPRARMAHRHDIPRARHAIRDVDVDDLAQELAKYRDVIDSWAREAIDRERRIEGARERKAHRLEREHAALIERERELASRAAEHAAEATRVELEAEQAAEEAERARELAEGLPEQLARERESVRVERLAVERDEQKATGTSAMAKLEALKEARKMYAERLGLTFEYGASERLRLKFKYIDARAPEREFVLAVRLRGASYEVVECSPRVDGLDALVRECNRSNDFGKFVRDARRAFVALANGIVSSPVDDRPAPRATTRR